MFLRSLTGLSELSFMLGYSYDGEMSSPIQRQDKEWRVKTALYGEKKNLSEALEP